MDKKTAETTDVSPDDRIFTDDGLPSTGVKAGTAEDREAMRRLGKKQLFKVGMLASVSAIC